MNRALTGGLSAGSSLALGLRLLDSFSSPVAPVFPEPLLCAEQTDNWHLPSIILGLVIGFLVGPILEAVITVRIWQYQQALRQLSDQVGGVVGRATYRIR